jgi:hypothetical protein
LPPLQSSRQEIEKHLKRKLNAQDDASLNAFRRLFNREPTVEEIKGIFPSAEEVKAHASSFTSRMDQLSKMSDKEILQMATKKKPYIPPKATAHDISIKIPTRKIPKTIPAKIQNIGNAEIKEALATKMPVWKKTKHAPLRSPAPAKSVTPTPTPSPRSSVSIEYRSPTTVLRSALRSAPKGLKRVIPIVSKIAQHPIVRGLGRASEVVALLGAGYEVGKSGIEVAREIKHLVRKPSAGGSSAAGFEAGTVGGVKVPLPSPARPRTQLVSTHTPKGYGLLPKGTANTPLIDAQGNKYYPSQVGRTKKSPSLKVKKSKVAHPSHDLYAVNVPQPILPKVESDLSFLTPAPLRSAYRTRVSPVKPIPTRIQLPEQFMSPSLSLATLPKVNRYRLGVSK